jgi:5-methylcytosine-specific restriction endonuclease McrA
MFSLKSFLISIRRGIGTLVEGIFESLCSPTPCGCCQQEYPLYELLTHTISDPYGVLDRHYRHICSSCAKKLRAIVDEKNRPLLRNRRIYQEIDVVKRHNERAIGQGLPGTLTLNEWVKTLDSLEWKCAYCGGEYEELDHWIPLAARQRGTTKLNCIPACSRCNRKKGSLHPSSIGESSLSPAAHQKIQQHMRQLHGDKQVVTEETYLSG